MTNWFQCLVHFLGVLCPGFQSLRKANQPLTYTVQRTDVKVVSIQIQVGYLCLRICCAFTALCFCQHDGGHREWFRQSE